MTRRAVVPRATPPGPAEVQAAHAELVAAQRRYWPGGQPNRDDQDGLSRRLANRFGLTAAAVKTALSTPL